jgi:hypothetical protein
VRLSQWQEKKAANKIAYGLSDTPQETLDAEDWS